MALEEYRRKRSFSLTPEPSGKKRHGAGGYRFVVQRHKATRLHYDFRLEMQGVLKSWAVPKGPPVEEGTKHLAVHVEDHPLDYRTFHGRIPEGQYGAGTVTIWDSGTYDPIEPSTAFGSDVDRALEKGHVRVMLRGKKLKGEYLLVRFGKEEKNWLMMKTGNGRKPVTAIKGLSAKTSMPRDVEPMLAHLADKPFDDPNWLYEIKWDGYRAIAEMQKGNVRLYSRHGQPYNDAYPQVVTDLQKIRHDAVIDGEIVALDKEGKSRFQLLQEYRRNPETTIVYYVFDLLYLDGHDLRGIAVTERKRLLSALVRDTEHVRYSGHVVKEGTKLFGLAKKKNVEGIMAKKMDSVYESKRSYSWQKIKNIQSEEAVICGFTKPRRTRKLFGAVILGQYGKDGTLRYVGHSGSGFTEKSLAALYRNMERLITPKCPFPRVPKTNEPATWIRPKLVAQIKFQERTKEGMLRQPIFMGLREDKSAKEATEDVPVSLRPTGAGTGEFTNLDKVFWPKDGYTKGDVIAYYDAIAPVILPYLKDRPESLNRHPDGIDGDSFYQKDMKDAPEWAKIVPLRSDTENKTIHWLVCNDRRTLTYMANLGCIELNPWIARYQHPDNPDFLVLDLDPEHIAFSEVVKTANVIKKLLDGIHADSFVKTSGKRGLHIFVPLGAKYTSEETRLFAELIARTIADKLPRTASVARMPEKRQHRVYVDFLQNRSGQTISAPYCIRPVPGATVSTPLSWDELTARLDPAAFTIRTVFARLDKKGDVWKKFIAHAGIDMKRSLAALNTS